MAAQFTPKVFAAVVLAIAGLLAATVITTFGIISSSRTVQNYGTVKTINVGVYWDSGCTNATTTINWGMLSPGGSSNCTFYVRNDGNYVVRLSMTTQNWNPTNASSLMTLAWNREGQALAAASTVSATLTLAVNANITGVTNFTFDTVIAGTEQ